MDKYYAPLRWDNSTPISDIFSDTYHSIESGLNEANYVFLQHNQLKERFTELKPEQNFIIAETGFGAGINFFSTCKLWNESTINKAHLHYISIEKYPLSPSDLANIIDNLADFKEIKQQFLDQYYLLLPGYHRFFIDNNIYLTLIIGDVCTTLTELDFKADAWYLDGFSPNKNHEMWDTKTLHEIARLSSQNTTFATYTAASQVRKNLLENGFNVFKDKGFGKKREMLYGSYDNNQATTNNKLTKPYYSRTSLAIDRKPQKIAIIGGGISGAATAHSLARSGKHVTVFEKNDKVAEEASGNYQGMLYGTWSIFGGMTMELSSSAYRLSNYLIKRLLTQDIDYQECGIIQLNHSEKQAIRNQQLLAHNFPSDFVTRIPNNKNTYEFITNQSRSQLNGVLFPRGMWLKPPVLVNKMLEHINIVIKTNHNIIEIEQLDDLSWIVKTEENEYKFDAVVLCNSFLVNQFNPTKNLQLRKIRGQTTTISAQNDLTRVICGDGYITPTVENKFTIGATFNFKNIHTEITNEDHIENIEHLKELLPELYGELDMSKIDGKASIRSSYTDYLPLVGPISDAQWFKQEYQKLAKDKNIKFTTDCKYLANLYINVGHGSKGILTAPISAEIIADYINNTPLATSEKLRQALHPNRILVNALVKNT